MENEFEGGGGLVPLLFLLTFECPYVRILKERK